MLTLDKGLIEKIEKKLNLIKSNGGHGEVTIVVFAGEVVDVNIQIKEKVKKTG